MDKSSRWKEAYLKNMQNEGSNFQALSLLELNKPKSLYRYRTGKEIDGINWDVKNLEEDCMCLCNPDKFNDPYDSYVNLDIEYLLKRAISEKEVQNMNRKSKREYKRAFKNELIEQEKEIKKVKEDLIKGLFIGCFTETETSILMWSHYANFHEGFCIEYDFDDLNNEQILLLPVLYQNAPVTDIIDTIMPLRFIITKEATWSYEREWRVIQTIESDELEYVTDGIRKYKTPKPKNIYLGCKANTLLEKALIKVCETKGIGLHKIKMKNDKFELYSDKIL